jgi:hypothetical protein
MQDAPATDSRAELTVAAWIALVAVLARLAFALATPDRGWAHSALYEGDALEWWRWARALGDPGTDYEYGLAMRAPGVAFLLHALAGLSFPALKLVWGLLAGLGCGAAYLAFRRCVPAGTAQLAGWLSAFAYGGYVQAGSLGGEAPYGALLCFLVLGHVACPRAWTAPVLGVGHGLATLLRPEHSLLLCLLLVRDARSGSRGLRASGLLLLCSLLPILPWTLSAHAATVRFNEVERETPAFDGTPRWSADARAFAAELPAFARAGNVAFLNARLGARGVQEVSAAAARAELEEAFGYVPEPLATWSLVSGKAGFDFALANHPRSTGGFSRAALADAFDAEPVFAFGRPSHLLLYNHGWRAGLGFIAADPGAWFALVARKLGIFLEGASLGYGAFDLPYGPAARRRPVDQATPRGGLAWRLAWGALVLGGAVVALRQRVAGVWLLVIASKLAVTILFYGYARQAASIQPAFQLLLALGVAALWARLGAPRLSSRVASLLVAALLALDLWRALDPPALDVGGDPPPRIAPGPPDMPGSFLSFDDLTLDPR